MPGPRDMEPQSPLALVSNVVCALAEIAIAALLMRAVGAFVQEHALTTGMLTYGGVGFTELNAGEAKLFLAHAVAGVPAALLLTDAATRLLGGRPAPWSARVLARPRLMAVLFALFAAVVTEVLARYVLGHTTISDDERVYLFQARQILAGHFTSPRPPFGPAVFQFEFVYPVPGTQDWSGAYPPGQSLFLALGLLVGHAHLMQMLCAGGIVYVAARFAHDLWGAETSVVTGALLATSPFLLFNAASLHNAVPATFFLLVAARHGWRALQEGRRRDYAWVGVGLGAALLFRPYDAVAFGLPLALVLLIAAVRSERSRGNVVGTSGLAIAAACALPFVLFLLAANHAETGHPLVPAYTAWLEKRFPGAHTVGFGPTAFSTPDHPEHTPQAMFSKGLVVLCRLSTWLFGWPLSFWPLLAMLLGIGRDRSARFLLLLLGTHFVAYAFYTLNAIHDVGSPYHLAEAPLIALLSARAIVRMSTQLTVFGEWLSFWPGRLALTCGLVGVLTFWPLEIQRLHAVAASVRVPLDAVKIAAGDRPALVIWKSVEPPGFTSWVFHPPLPGPALDDQFLWVLDSDQIPEVIAAYPNRIPLRFEFGPDGRPHVSRYH